MYLLDVERVAVADSERVRIQGRVRYETDGAEELVWFEVPERYAQGLATSGNPWCVALLPLAVTLKEPLRIYAPVDRTLLEGCRAIQEIWAAWYPQLAPVAVEAESQSLSGVEEAGRTGLFFSGGVDSFATLLEFQRSPTHRSDRVTDLLLIQGADIPLSDSSAFHRLRTAVAEVAEAFDTSLVDLTTNLRETRWRVTDYPHLSHGALLAGCGLAMENRFSRLVIASSAPYYRLQPYGSHPITDPLYSSQRTRIRHHGARLDRPQKIASIAHDPVVLEHLRVCWLGGNDSNCGRCPKCLLTMVGLELSGSLDRCKTLPGPSGLKALRQLYLESGGTYSAYFVAKIFSGRARRAGRGDLVRLLERAIRRSDRLRLAVDAVSALGRLGLLPERVAGGVRWRLLRSSVRY